VKQAFSALSWAREGSNVRGGGGETYVIHDLYSFHKFYNFLSYTIIEQGSRGGGGSERKGCFLFS